MLLKLLGHDHGELIRAIANDSDDVIFAKDARRRYTFANPAAAALIGRPVDEVLGHTSEEVLADQDAARRIMESDEQVIASGEPALTEVCVVQPDGTRRWWSTRKTPFRDAKGRVIGLLGISRDITDRKLHEAERESLARQWHLALDAAGMGWWHYDLRSRLVTYDARCAAIFDLPGTQRPSTDFAHTIVPEDLPVLDDALRDALDPQAPGASRVEFRIRRGDAIVWVEAHGMALAEAPNQQRAATLIGTVADVTDRRSTEQALRETNARLKDADRQKDEFIATLAHELRNPLAPLRTIVAVLKAKDDDPLIRKLRPVMDRQIAHLTRLVDDLLDVSRITRGVIQLHEQVLDLGAVAKASAEPLRAAMAAAHVRLEVHVESPSPRVLGDETRLAQCVTNLLSNALKFTPAGGFVSVRVKHEGPLAVLEVRDTGAGITPASLERIFELFVQDQPSGLRGNAGLGIGLALTRKLVELHGGSIRAHSRGPGLGSKFRIELPLAAQAETAPTRAHEARAEAGTDAMVLVVDDNADAADSLREMLAMAGYRASAAYTGQGALDAIEESAPDAALLDIGLPDIDGYEVCRRVRARGHGSQPALIALTGWGQERDKERAAAAGFNGHLTKPADPGELLALLRSLLDAARRRSAAEEHIG